MASKARQLPHVLHSSIGETVTDKVLIKQKMGAERWVQHYSGLCSRQNVMSPLSLDTIEYLPTMGKLNAEPTLEELSKIPPDLTKHCKITLLLPLHEVQCKCWQEGAVPQYMRVAKIINLYKDKAERSHCNNDIALS